jgi:hypothetical protein
MSEYVFRKVRQDGIGRLGLRQEVVLTLVLRIEKCLSEPKSELNKRRIKNFWAEAKFHHLPVPALRALLQVRRYLRLAGKSVENLPPHRRIEVAQLARAVGDTSELFQFETPMSEDPHLQQLR